MHNNEATDTNVQRVAIIVILFYRNQRIDAKALIFLENTFKMHILIVKKTQNKVTGSTVDYSPTILA